MAEISFEAIFESKQMEEYLSKLQKKIKETKGGSSALQKRMSPIVFSDIIKHFENKEGPDGAWEPWGEARQKQYDREGKGELLRYNGTLMNSLQPGSGKTQANAEFMRWYTPVEYSNVHNEGTDKVPKREFMWISDDALELTAKATLDWILEE